MSEVQSICVTYSPFSKKFYRGDIAEDANFGRDSSYERLAVMDPTKKMGDGRIEFIDSGADIMRKIQRKMDAKQLDAVIDTTEITNITNVDMLQEVIGSMWKNTYARNATTSIAVPKLQLKVPYRSAKMAAREKVPELNVATETNTEFSQASFALWKNVVDIYASMEARMQGTIEPLNYDIQQASGALTISANTQIVTAIEGSTTASKGDWGAKTSGISDRDPIDDITTEWVVLNDLHYTPDTLCMHPRVWADFLANTNAEKGTAIQAVQRNINGTFTFPIVNGITAVVDSAFSNTKATLLDKSTMLLGEGPMVAEQYRDPHRGADGYIVRHFMQPLLPTLDASRTMTSVSA